MPEKTQNFLITTVQIWKHNTCRMYNVRLVINSLVINVAVHLNLAQTQRQQKSVVS